MVIRLNSDISTHFPYPWEKMRGLPFSDYPWEWLLFRTSAIIRNWYFRRSRVSWQALFKVNELFLEDWGGKWNCVHASFHTLTLCEFVVGLRAERYHAIIIFRQFDTINIRCLQIKLNSGTFIKILRYESKIYILLISIRLFQKNRKGSMVTRTFV